MTREPRTIRTPVGKIAGGNRGAGDVVCYREMINPRRTRYSGADLRELRALKGVGGRRKLDKVRLSRRVKRRLGLE